MADKSVSTGYVPSENNHSGCARRETDGKFYRTAVPAAVAGCLSRVWGERLGSNAEGTATYTYRSEQDVVNLVRMFLTDIIQAAGLPLELAAEVGIKHIRPDLIAIYDKLYLVAVVEVKKPGPNILTKSTVMGELLDQMLLVEGFYRIGPVVGILTSGTEWMVAWLPEDEDAFLDSAPAQSSAAYSTPTKSSASGPKSESPPGNTPSQQRPVAHGVEEDNASEGTATVSELTGETDRSICTTTVVNAETQFEELLTLLYTAVVRMSQTRMGFRGGKSSMVFVVMKEQPQMKWVCADPEEWTKTVNFDKFPRNYTKNLVILEDLGRGSSGKVWLAATKTAVCVLKFSNKDGEKGHQDLKTECSRWGALYPGQFDKCTAVEQWSGSWALRMAHFSTIAEDKREDQHLKDAIVELLLSFEEKGFIHSDVRWRNMGIHNTGGGKMVPVLYDLESVLPYKAAEHGNWIHNALEKLYPAEKQDKEAH